MTDYEKAKMQQEILDARLHAFHEVRDLVHDAFDQLQESDVSFEQKAFAGSVLVTLANELGDLSKNAFHDYSKATDAVVDMLLYS